MQSIKKTLFALNTALILLLAPALAFAQVPLDPNTSTSSGYCANVSLSGGILVGGSTVGDVIKYFTCLILNSIIPLLFAIATLVFIWGAVKFIQAGDSSEARETGRQFMLWGIVSLAVMFSIWGLVKILGNTFHVGNVLPSLPVDKTIK